MKGSELLLKCLKHNGVDTIFGYPGGSVIPLYDALYEDNHFNHIRTAHEQGATHAADGYSRSTGKVGVCIVTSGPGATNTVTGIASAYMDSVPMVVITGQVTRDLLGRDSFQEVDITGITFSITKHSYIVRDVKELPEIVDKAFEIATEGRPGPVLIDIPKDIFTSIIEDDFQYEGNPLCKCESSIDEEKLAMVIEAINNSKKPMIYAGGGVKKSGVSEMLTKFAEKIDSPVVSTVMGLGAISRENPLSLGMVGMHGFKENNLAVSNCDLLIGIGARFSDRVIGDPNNFATNAKVIHLDIDSSEISKNIESSISVIGDLREMLSKVIKGVDKKDCSTWREEIENNKDENKVDENQFHPTNILKLFNEKFNKDTFVATDVGQHQMWTAQHWKFNFPNSFITSGGLGTMGFGLGAAIGAKAGNPDKKVVLVTGDGSFRMNCNEMFTLSRYNLPVIILLLNNCALGMVRQWQRMFFNERFSQTDMDNCVDYVNLSKSFGVDAYSAESIDELKEILSKDEVFEGPVLIECKICKDENVYPIVPPGKAIESPILSWE
ncbi:acetolactate synthase large subunit [Clostridium cylindrosporum DSM 605]|uniref:Acetolactate synthase n=2 Tax=Clostridium cylindrosporum TaxID=1495 RepID=A0A0J8D9I5_CLOCY|nr:biosynthetic-type acetolactate synthase large subunit [Clostridium cylindrosporum]KMT22705.1 acetolactate synthase large subunit [Clostridium cylindrosporum DSM 605]